MFLIFRWKEAMAMRSALYGCPMIGMIKFMPEVCQVTLLSHSLPEAETKHLQGVIVISH